jgi:hypothetical protein
MSGMKTRASFFAITVGLSGFSIPAHTSFGIDPCSLEVFQREGGAVLPGLGFKEHKHFPE